MNLKTVAALAFLKQTLDALPPDAFPEQRARIRALMIEGYGDEDSCEPIVSDLYAKSEIGEGQSRISAA